MKQYRQAIRQFMISVNLIDGIYEIAAKQSGIKYNLLALLYALDDGAPHSQKEICQHWCIPKTTVNTIVQECVRRGYITLDAGGGTKEKYICLTEQGRAYAKPILERLYAMEERAMEKTLAQYPVEFVPAVEEFARNLMDEIEH